jgi:hypothetical protein
MTVWHATFVEVTNKEAVMEQMTENGQKTRNGQMTKNRAKDRKWANGKNGQMTKNRAKDRKWAHR